MLDASFCIQVNARLTEAFGGIHGVRSPEGLESAIARYDNVIAYKGAGPLEASVALCEGIVRNHPFLDGNKRTALAALHVSLGMSGLQLSAPDMEQVEMMEGLANRKVLTSEFLGWVRDATGPREALRLLAQRDADPDAQPTPDAEQDPVTFGR